MAGTPSFSDQARERPRDGLPRARADRRHFARSVALPGDPRPEDAPLLVLDRRRAASRPERRAASRPERVLPAQPPRRGDAGLGGAVAAAGDRRFGLDEPGS